METELNGREASLWSRAARFASLARMTVAWTLMLPAVTLSLILEASAPRTAARLERKAACADASKVSTVPSKLKLLIMTGW